MSTLLNAPCDVPAAPPLKVLVLAHPDYGEPTVRYLRRRGCQVVCPRFSASATAEDCAALLFPPNSGSDAGEPFVPLFMWNAFDAVVIQDLWRSTEENRLIAFGCTVAATDYYIRGNFDQTKVVIVTDPAFYGCRERTDAACSRQLRQRFDDNEQIEFVPLLGADSALSALERIGGAMERSRSALRMRVLDGDRLLDVDSSEQRRGWSVLSSALVQYVRKCARVIVIDDSARTIRSVAARFGQMVRIENNRKLLHVCDVEKGEVASFSSFEELRRLIGHLVRESAANGQITLVVTDILFDGVDWDDERGTGVDLIHEIRTAQRDHSAARIGIVGLTGVISPLVMTSAFQRGADAVVTKSSNHGASPNHARDVDDAVMYKTLLTLGYLCFQCQFLDQKMNVEPRSARQELTALWRILPSYAVSPHLQAKWEGAQYHLQREATYVPAAPPPQREIRRAARRR